jgi:glycosyltransferase involved in cell wall biosynthesis
MIAIIVPAHNEQAVISSCIESLLAAATHPGLNGEDVRIVIVMDACTDRTAQVVSEYAVQALSVDFCNVGKSRAAGADTLLNQGARWLAFTDADTVVPTSWLADQLDCATDAVCGTVKVEDWSVHPDPVRTRYDSLYTPVEGHRHIHGANLGVSAQAYLRAGGFKPLTAHEDVNLVADLEASGATIAWTASNCVTTSARIDCRCRCGFGDYLRSLVVTLSVENG